MSRDDISLKLAYNEAVRRLLRICDALDQEKLNKGEAPGVRKAAQAIIKPSAVHTLGIDTALAQVNFILDIADYVLAALGRDIKSLEGKK